MDPPRLVLDYVTNATAEAVTVGLRNLPRRPAPERCVMDVRPADYHHRLPLHLQ